MPHVWRAFLAVLVSTVAFAAPATAEPDLVGCYDDDPKGPATLVIRQSGDSFTLQFIDWNGRSRPAALRPASARDLNLATKDLALNVRPEPRVAVLNGLSSEFEVVATLSSDVAFPEGRTRYVLSSWGGFEPLFRLACPP